MDMITALFFVFSALILVTAAMVAFRPRPVEGAMWLILNFFLTAGLYVLLGSHFVAAIQILVYAGAIMVLFVFVIMLLNLDFTETGNESSMKWSTIVLLVSFLSFILLSLQVATPTLLEKLPALPADSMFGTVESASRVLLRDYLLGFEAAGVILLLAIVGVGLLAHRKAAPRVFDRKKDWNLPT